MSADTAAIVSLLLAVAAVVLWAVIRLIRSPFTPLQSMFYFFNLFATRLLWRADLPRRFPLAENQGAVIVCNHRSTIDPMIFYPVVRTRVVHWMVAQIFSERSPMGWFMRVVESIMVRPRSADTAALKTAIRLARQGRLVGVFPEGSVNMSDEFMLKVRPGAILIALKARVPIVPCYIEGTPYNGVAWGPLLMPARVKLVIGEPIDLSAYYGRERDANVVRELTIRCVREIAKLAGRDDFEPQIAGRGWKSWEKDVAVPEDDE